MHDVFVSTEGSREAVENEQVHSTSQGLPYSKDSVMNLNSNTAPCSKYQKRARNPALVAEIHSETYDPYCGYYLDFLHINLLYCGGTNLEFNN